MIRRWRWRARGHAPNCQVCDQEVALERIKGTNIYRCAYCKAEKELTPEEADRLTIKTKKYATKEQKLLLK